MVPIRVARDQDSKELCRLSNQLGYPCSPEQCQEFLNELLLDPEHIVYLAENREGLITGYVHVFKTKRLFLDPFSELGGLVVEEKYRNKGVGKALLAASENWAKKQGCFEMRIRSNVLREKAHDFYLDQGYVINKKQKIFIKEFS